MPDWEMEHSCLVSSHVGAVLVRHWELPSLRTPTLSGAKGKLKFNNDRYARIS